MLWLLCQGPLEMKQGGGVWRWRAQERRAHGNLYLGGCQQWTSGFLAVKYILAHLATFLPKMLQMLPDVYWRSGEGKKSSPHTPAET